MEERARIAGEMHDLLGHRIGLISMHAGALQLAAERQAPPLAAQAELLHTTAGTAMDELRGILGVLRHQPNAETGERGTREDLSIPIVLALVGPLTERRRPAPRIVGAAAVVTLGAAVAAGLGGGSLHGVMLSLGALVGEVAFSLLALPLLPKLGPLRVAAYPAALAVPMLLAASIALDGTSSLRLPTPTEAAAFGYLGVLVTATAFFLWYDALRRLGAARAGLFAGLVPAVTLSPWRVMPAPVGPGR